MRDWIDSLNANRNLSFANFNKAQNEADKMVQIGADPNGNPIAIDKKQANRVAENRRILERIKNIRNPDERTRREIERRQAFDDMFNPEKLNERMKKEEDARKAKDEADKNMRDDIRKLKELLVDNNGAAV